VRAAGRQAPTSNALRACGLAGGPFAPLVGWPAGEGRWLGLGLGDLLVAMAAPLVFRKAYGLRAGRVAAASSIAVVGAVVVASGSGWLGGTFPVMVVLGPVIACEHQVARRVVGRERTTVEYLAAEPRARGARTRRMVKPTGDLREV
jgi:hypothetical protein